MKGLLAKSKCFGNEIMRSVMHDVGVSSVNDNCRSRVSPAYGEQISEMKSFGSSELSFMIPFSPVLSPFFTPNICDVSNHGICSFDALLEGL